MNEGRVKVEVEKGAIRKFVRAIGEENPLYLDEEYAQEHGYASVVAPPTFPITFEVPHPGLDIELSRSLHGGQEFSYKRPIVAGDVLFCESKLTDTFERTGGSGGKMTFYIVELSGYDRGDELVFASKATIIYR